LFDYYVFGDADRPAAHLPEAARGPKVSIEMAQAATMMSSGGIVPRLRAVSLMPPPRAMPKPSPACFWPSSVSMVTLGARQKQTEE
jgi:hypothetical protein